MSRSLRAAPSEHPSSRARIERAPRGRAHERFDAIVVGGGIYGITIATEAARRGLRPLLLERGDFGSGTSENSLRIVHGGLRYLQSLDLPRFRESVKAQNWFLRAVPEFVEPLPCLMPLYGQGLYRRPLLRIALAANSLMARALSSPLPAGRITSADEARSAFPSIDTDGLRGAALWYDAFIASTPRLFIELLRRACAAGASALNYVAVEELLETGGAVEGVGARDLETGDELEYRAPVVINATGPESRSFSRRCGAERPELFVPSIAWNLLFDRQAVSDHALAVRPRARGSQVYFLVPWKGALLVGTGHAPWAGDVREARPSPEMLARFIEDLNRAVPSLKLQQDEVLRVFSGLLPAAEPGSARLSRREVIVDHASKGGPRGLFSLCGVKLSVAPRVAGKVLARAFPDTPPRSARRPTRPGAGTGTGTGTQEDFSIFWMPRPGEEGWKQPLRRAIAEEAVVHLDDLLLRRSSLGDHPQRAAALAPDVCHLFGWDPPRTRAELARMDRSAGALSMPTASAPPR